MHGKLEKYEVNKVLIQIDHSMYGIRQSHDMLGGHGSGHTCFYRGKNIVILVANHVCSILSFNTLYTQQ